MLFHFHLRSWSVHFPSNTPAIRSATPHKYTTTSPNSTLKIAKMSTDTDIFSTPHYFSAPDKSPAPNVPSVPSDVCYFYKLSGEIHNGVYEYAEDCPLRFRRDHSSDSEKFYRHELDRPAHQGVPNFRKALSEALLEANQLQYVNKQMRAETLGLGLRYNESSFLGVGELGYFVQWCAPSHLGRLRMLTFEYFGLSHLGEAAETPKFFDFATSIPKFL